jgi:hypothetical protein
MTDNREASMSEIKPVYQAKAEHVDWYNISKDVFDILTKDGFETRILYSAAALEALQAENERLTKCLIGANANHEQFERQYYLELNKVDDLTEVTAAQAKRIAELESPLNPYERVDLQGKLYITGLQNQIEALRKQVEILQRPLDDEIISRIVCLVKNVSDEELASNVFESVRNMTNWNKSTPAEFLVLFDKTSAQKGTE